MGPDWAALYRIGDSWTLRVGDWRTSLRADTVIRHDRHTLSNRLIVRQSEQPPFQHRYRLPWALQLAPLTEATYDALTAEVDDPGLALTILAHKVIASLEAAAADPIRSTP